MRAPELKIQIAVLNAGGLIEPALPKVSYYYLSSHILSFLS